MKEIDLEKIYTKISSRIPQENNYSFREAAIDAMKEACKQTLELAAENTNMSKAFDYGRFDENTANFNRGNCTLFYKETSGHGDCGYEAVKINKQSILDTINQIK